MEPLLLVLIRGSPLAQEHVQQHCLLSLFSTCPSALQLSTSVIADLAHREQCSVSSVLIAKLACLKNAMATQSTANTVEAHEELLGNALYSADEQVSDSLT